MKIKIIFIIIAFTALFGGMLCGCKQKDIELWVWSGEESFSIYYPAFDEVFDGAERNFRVKDNEAFENTLKEVSEYKCEIPLADSSENAYLFEKNGKYFLIYLGEKNYYVMRRAQGIIFENHEEIWFDCIPMIEYSYVAEGVEVNYTWNDIKEYYELYSSAIIDNENKKITVTSEDGEEIMVTFADNILKATKL